ncbi:DUF5677 domain-containing protein [Streptomyces sp. NPDC101776]|uniref:DUF5677 domain-containing protein n=1 Tax=Streptomyces sp. NPDC101776 TaxID=3366146 RepID=UPI0038258152
MDEKFRDYVMKVIEDSGIEVANEQNITDLATESVDKFVDQMGKSVAGHALQNGRTFRANQRVERGFNKRLHRRYRPAFKAYIVTSSCAREAGEAVAAKERTSLNDHQSATFTALVWLHAKACRVAGEVYALLTNGFPEGALARCRTLHEMAVVAAAIADCVGDPDNEDLAIRYLDHAVVDQWRSAQQYQDAYQTLGMEPLEQEFLDKVENRFNAVIAKYGTDFKGAYGWAKRYCPNAKFEGLETKVQMNHMRGYYKWASNEVHAGSRSLILNVTEFRGEDILRAGKTNVGLTDPASMALTSLYQVTVMLLTEGLPDSVDIAEVVTMKALDEMCTRTSEMFLEIDSRIMKDEEEFLRSVNL